MQNVIGKHLRLTSLEEPPFVTVDRFKNGSIYGYKGYCFEIINTLRDIYNFTYTVEQPLDEEFGTEYGNKSWSGMIGMIVKNESDMGIGPFTYTFSRQKVVAFTISHYEETNTILIPQAAQESKDYIFAKPFRFQVWLGLIIVVLLLPLFMWTSSKISNHLGFGNRMLIKGHSSLMHYYIFTFGVLSLQSGRGSRFNNYSSAIIVAMMWSLLALVFIHGYIGTLASFHSLPKFKPIITSLEDLPQSSLRWIVRSGTDLDSLFMEAKDGIYKLIGDGLRRHQNLLSNSDDFGMDQVINGTGAYIRGKSLNEVFIERDYKQTGQCRLSMAERDFYKTQQGFVLSKQSPLKFFFDQKIQQMKESGLTEYWRKKYWPTVSQCNPALRRFGPRALSIQDMHSAFIIWGIGAGISFLIFVTEVIASWLLGCLKRSRADVATFVE